MSLSDFEPPAVCEVSKAYFQSRIYLVAELGLPMALPFGSSQRRQKQQRDKRLRRINRLLADFPLESHWERWFQCSVPQGALLSIDRSDFWSPSRRSLGAGKLHSTQSALLQ